MGKLEPYMISPCPKIYKHKIELNKAVFLKPSAPLKMRLFLPFHTVADLGF
jgi:hypothetical protein